MVIQYKLEQKEDLMKIRFCTTGIVFFHLHHGVL